MILAISSPLFRREGGAGAGNTQGSAASGGREGDYCNARPDPKQRRADAVGLLAERALAVGFEGGQPRDAGVVAHGREWQRG